MTFIESSEGEPSDVIESKNKRENDFFDDVTLPTDQHAKILHLLNPSSNSFLSNPKLEESKHQKEKVNNPNVKQVTPILDSSSTYAFKEENNLFYSEFGEKKEGDELRDTIVLREGQNPSFKNIEIGKEVRALLASDPEASKMLKNSFDFASDQKDLLSKIQIAESVTEEPPQNFGIPQHLNINVIQNQIFTKKKKPAKVSTKNPKKKKKTKLKKVLSNVLKKPISGKAKKSKRAVVTESDRQLDLSASRKLEELQNISNLKDSIENFNFIGKEEKIEMLTDPNANFHEYMKKNFKKAKKYMPQEYVDTQPQTSKTAPSPPPQQQKKPKSKIKNILLMGICEEDELLTEHLQDPKDTLPVHQIDPPRLDSNDPYNTGPKNDKYYNSDDSGKMPFIRDSDAPNQNILLSNNPYQSQSFHEPGLFNRLMSNHPKFESKQSQDERGDFSSDDHRFKNNFEPNQFYDSEPVEEEKEEVLETVQEGNGQSDFIERFSQERREPETPAESPLERKTKYSDLIAKKDHFMKKYNIKLGAKKKGKGVRSMDLDFPDQEKVPSKSKKSLPLNQTNQQLPSMEDLQQHPNYPNLMDELNLKQTLKATNNPRRDKPRGARKNSARFKDHKYSDNAPEKLNLDQKLSSTDVQNITSNQSIDTLLNMDQRLKQSIEHQLPKQQKKPNSQYREKYKLGKESLERPGIPNVYQASNSASNRPNYQQTSFKKNQAYFNLSG